MWLIFEGSAVRKKSVPENQAPFKKKLEPDSLKTSAIRWIWAKTWGVIPKIGQFQGTPPLEFHLQIREKINKIKDMINAKRMAEKSVEAIEALQ